MNTQTLFGIVVVPAIIGLVQVLRDLGLPTRAAPAAAVILGILAGLAQLMAGQWPWIQAATVGLTLGLSACGLYSGAKTVLTNSSTTSTTPPADTEPVTIKGTVHAPRRRTPRTAPPTHSIDPPA